MLRVVEREARVFRRLWRGSIFSGVVTPVLFLTAIGVGLGDLVDERNGRVEGLSYLEFVTPGLLVATAMQTAAANSLWPVMAGHKWMRFYHGMISTPIRAADVYAGEVTWTGVRTTVFASAFLAVSASMGGVLSPWSVLAVPAAVLCAVAFAAPLAAFSATRETDAAFPVVMRLGVLPLFLFSGTFFPLEVLPGWLQALSVLSPLFHGVELARGATTGSLGGLAAAGHVAVLVAVVALSWRWGTRTFTRRLAG